MRLKIASRRSDLARLQAHLVASALRKVRPEIEIEFNFKASVGDLNPDRSLMDFAKGAFTSDFVADLLSGSCDMVVHSWKDLPIEETPGTAVVATMERADVRDLLLVPKKVVAKKPSRLRILASSPRRAYNLTDFLPTILPWSVKTEFTPVRGNVPTRLAKLISGEGDGLIVAKAAIDRLLNAAGEDFREAREQVRATIDQCDWMVLPISENPAAAAQGALAIEIKAERQDLRELLQGINEQTAETDVREERKTLSRYGGGCHQKIGVNILSRGSSRLLSLRGLTDSGEVLNKYGWITRRKVSRAANVSMIFPDVMAEAKWFAREALPEAKWKQKLEGAQAIFAARALAWPKGVSARQGQVVWTAGVASWQALAREGIWTHGCADQLGDGEDPRLDALAGLKLNWVRLTHDRAEQGREGLATYTLTPLETTPDLTGKTHFFWASGSSFLRAKELFPREIATGNHACGMGKTTALIRDSMGKEPEVFLTWSEWRQSVLSPGDENENG